MKYYKIFTLLIGLLANNFMESQVAGTPYLPNSDIPFSFLYGGSASESMRNNIGNIEPTADGGYIIVGGSGSSNSFDVSATNNGGQDAWILKVDALGKKQWEKLYGGSLEDYAVSVKQTTDGGYIVVCTTRSSNTGNVGNNTTNNITGWILKLDASGNIMWNKIYGGQFGAVLSDVIQTSDGGYLITGSISGNGGDITEPSLGVGGDIWLLKLNSSGNKLWDKRYGGNNDDESPKIIKTSDGGYAIVAYSQSSASGTVSAINHGSEDILVLKLDASTNKQWDNLYGGSGQEHAYSIRQTVDGGYIITGFSASPVSGNITDTNAGSYDGWILKINASGTVQWNKLFGTATVDYLFDATQTADGGYIVTGLYNNNGTIFKLNSTGNTVWQNQYASSGLLISIKPTIDGLYITGGAAFNNPSGVDPTNGQLDLWIMKIDQLGNIVWVPDVGQ